MEGREGDRERVCEMEGREGDRERESETECAKMSSVLHKYLCRLASMDFLDHYIYLLTIHQYCKFT